MTFIDSIPSTEQRPVNATTSSLVTQLRQVKPSRRAALRGLGIAILASALAPIEWATSKAAQAAGPKTEHTGCAPSSYGEQQSNWWSGATACYGGWRRGTYPCASGWHFEGSRYYSDEGAHSTRLATSCGGKNAWRWKVGSSSYRCSDATTEVVWNSGERYTDLTISVCGV